MKKLLFFFLYPMFLFGQTQIGQDINGANNYDFLGYSVQINSAGNIIAVLAPGYITSDNTSHVAIYNNINNTWQKIGENINMEHLDSNSNKSISLNSAGNIIAIGAPNYSSTNKNYIGRVKVYQYLNNSWVQMGNTILDESNGSFLGRSVGLSSDGTILTVSSPSSISNKGFVRIFRYSNDSWVQIGNDIIGEYSGNFLGLSTEISANGDVVAISSNGNDGMSEYQKGKVNIYKNINNDWQKIGNTIERNSDSSIYTWDLSLSKDGNVVAISSPGNEKGTVNIYKYINNSWQQLGNTLEGEFRNDFFGSSLDLNNTGDIIAVGAIENDENGINSGKVTVFQYFNNIWNPVGSIFGESASDRLGSAININADGSIIIVGSASNDVNGDSSGKARVYDLSSVLSSSYHNEISKFNFSPNPVKDILTIQLSDNSNFKKAVIYNNLGQFIKSSKELTIDISNLSKGIYVVQVETNQGKIAKKLIIE